MNNLLRYSQQIIYTLVLGYFTIGQSFGSEIVKDPTRPLINFGSQPLDGDTNVEQKKSNTSLILQGVLVENGRKVAVINNQLVRVGEQIEGYTVTGIIPYGAQLSLEEETLSLSLVSENIKISK